MLISNGENEMKRSPNYRLTVRKGVKKDERALQKLRDEISERNRILAESDARTSWGAPLRYYVKCQGRGPRVVNGETNSYRYQMCLPLEFADRMDAYVYQR